MLLSGGPDCGAVDGIRGGLLHAAVAGCLAVGGAAATAACEGGAEGGGAGEVVGGHGDGRWGVWLGFLF